LSKMVCPKKTFSVRQIAFLGLLLSLALVLSYVEALLTPLMALPPGVKIGLSNIAVMYALFLLNAPSAVVLVVLKSFFALLTRGPVSFWMSLSGGVLSVLAMLLLIRLKKAQISYLLISIFGGMFHNIGQVATASVLLGSGLALAYLPVLLISGVGMGAVTGLLYRAAAPYFKQITFKTQK